jgi:hypothetical protein
MPDGFHQLFQFDWRIFLTAIQKWLDGGNPYGALAPHTLPGAFAYPPTALTWLALWLPLGIWGFWLFSCVQIVAWFKLMRRAGRPSQGVLLAWSPVIVGLLLGQTTLAVVLILWWAFLVPRRGWVCGLLLALALTKPQTAILPVIWLLWHTRRDETRRALWGGLVTGTILLALPPTLHDPGIWQDWIVSISHYRARTTQSFPWEGWGGLILLLSAWLWHRQMQRSDSVASKTPRPLESIWPWWLAMGLFPHGSLYPAVMLLPIMRPATNYWSLSGLLVSALLIGPSTGVILPIILAGHILAAWMINGGPRAAPIHAGTDSGLNEGQGVDR